jgi:hypothetical protein
MFYGDNTRWFIATVIDASPPYGFEGRVKIRVHGLHDKSTRNIPQVDLPWAQCVVPTTEGGISGIGRIPQLQSGALVFGFFMDGISSQTPIVVGSMPHIEFPTERQVSEIITERGREYKPNELYSTIISLSVNKTLPVQNERTGSLGRSGIRAREKACMQFFISIGYSVRQAIAITANLTAVSGMKSGQGGIADWSRDRRNKLQLFSNKYTEFYTQLAFVAYELRGEYSLTNIRMLQKNKLKGSGELLEIFSQLYLKRGLLDEATKASERLERNL